MKRKGFTLIELMITVSIVGILSLMGRAKFINYSEQLKVRQARTQMKVLEMALKSHFKDTGGFPAAYGSKSPIGLGRVNGLGNNTDGQVAGSEFIATKGAGAHYTMAGWEWTLITGRKITGSPAPVPAGWMGPYTLSVPNDPWGHRYVLEDWTMWRDERVSMIVCLGPKGVANGSAIPAGAAAGGYVMVNLEQRKNQTQWLDREGFSIIPRGGAANLLPDFMRPIVFAPNVSDDDYNIVLWLE